jgi:oligopeptide transport system ATP-binding protein
MSAPLLQVDGLRQHIPSGKGVVRAVDGVSFTIRAGETLGLVGESGCGKSTLGKTIVGLMHPTGGRVLFGGAEISSLSRRQRRAYSSEIAMVYQDPFGSLNPRLTVGQIVGEPFLVHQRGDKAERRHRVMGLLDRVGLQSYAYERYPHELSGGQRQRVGIARALALDPKLIICDEPVSALDVSVQAQVINLLVELQAERGLSYLFISHDLAVVQHISDRIAVMYLGKLVEVGSADEVWFHRKHPYTRALIGSAPFDEEPVKRSELLLRGDTPSPIDVPSGCRFRTRCPIATTDCAFDEPSLREVGETHLAACHFATRAGQLTVVESDNAA